MAPAKAKPITLKEKTPPVGPGEGPGGQKLFSLRVKVFFLRVMDFEQNLKGFSKD